MRQTGFILMIFVISMEMATAAEFGRLFTTPEQRNRLDALRYQSEATKIDISLEAEKTGDPEEDQEALAPISLGGLIYRKNGNNAAWINEASTIKGDLSLQDFEINTRKISPDSVEITLPGGTETIKLKVGEKYLPSSREKVDIDTN